MKKNKKVKTGKSNKKGESSPPPVNLPSPRRGAFPSPQSDIDSARPYIPGPSQDDRNEHTDSDSHNDEE